MSIAALSGHLTLSQNFAWMGTYTALIAFAVAASLEIVAYYVPWLDHFLDSIASPGAIVAGTIVTASLITDMSPFLKWTLAFIAGGGAAAAVQSLTVLTRGASLVGTGGLANPVVATAELGGSILTSALALIIPVFTVLVILALLLVAGSKHPGEKGGAASPDFTVNRTSQRTLNLRVRPSYARSARLAAGTWDHV
jgi:hypothetical protein